MSRKEVAEDEELRWTKLLPKVVRCGGRAYGPRRARKNLRGKQGRIKRRAMFARLRNAAVSRLRPRRRPYVGFFGRVTRIARMHQERLRDRPAPGMADVRYPSPKLFGF
jgi:hypothetical protein